MKQQLILDLQLIQSGIPINELIQLGLDRNHPSLWHEISKQIPWKQLSISERMKIAKKDNTSMHIAMIHSIECDGLNVSELLKLCQTINHHQMYKKVADYIIWGDFSIEKRLEIATQFHEWHITSSMLKSINWEAISFEDVVLLAASKLSWHIQENLAENLDMEKYSPRELNQIGVLGDNSELWEAIHKSQKWLNATIEEMLSL